MGNKLTKLGLFTAVLVAYLFVSPAYAQLASTSVSNGSGTPAGACTSGSLYVNSADGKTWTCTGGAWALAPPSSVYSKSCNIQIGNGLNAIPAATYPIVGCKNDTGATITMTAVQCYADSGSSTCDGTTSHSGTPDILTAPVTGTTTFAAGTQSATTTVLNGEWLTGSLVADGTTKQIILHIVGTL